VIAPALLALALAEVPGNVPPSSEPPPRAGSFEIFFAGYSPNIDSEFHNGATPYATTLGTGRGFTFHVSGAKTVYDKWGSVDVGVSVGWFRDTGHGVYAITSGGVTAGGASPETSSLNVIPTAVFGTYRFDWAVDRYNVPVVPYTRLALERYNWWVIGSGGKTMQTGATNGWSVGFGLALLLDWFDRSLSRELQRDTGVRHTYAFVETVHASVNDFGSNKSWDMSDKQPWTLGGGIRFDF